MTQAQVTLKQRAAAAKIKTLEFLQLANKLQKNLLLLLNCQLLFQKEKRERSVLLEIFSRELLEFCAKLQN